MKYTLLFFSLLLCITLHAQISINRISTPVVGKGIRVNRTTNTITEPCPCICDLQIVFNNNNIALNGGGNIGSMWLYQDVTHLNNYTAYEYDGMATFYDNSGTPVKIADFGHDPAGSPGNGYIHLFTLIGDSAIFIDATGQQLFIKNSATGFSNTVTPPSTNVNVTNTWPVESGIIAVNPIVADTSFLAHTTAGTLLPFTIPGTSTTSYFYTITGYTNVLSSTLGTSISVTISYTDENGIVQSQVLVPPYSTLGVGLSNVRTVWTQGGSTITLSGTIAGIGTISYDSRLSITKAYK